MKPPGWKRAPNARGGSRTHTGIPPTAPSTRPVYQFRHPSDSTPIMGKISPPSTPPANAREWWAPSLTPPRAPAFHAPGAEGLASFLLPQDRPTSGAHRQVRVLPGAGP